MKSIVFTQVVESITFPKPMFIFQNKSQSELILLHVRRRKHLNHDT